MKACYQTGKQSVWAHGLSVWGFTERLINSKHEGFVLPEWYLANEVFILNSVYDLETIRLYNIYHDCGKPFCLVVTEDGRRHFPNHAEESAKVWSSISDNKKVGELIGLDMLLHTCNAKELEALNLDIKTAFTLLITALAELHSNAEMFGGIQSTSFKIKYKRWNKRGKQILKKFK